LDAGVLAERESVEQAPPAFETDKSDSTMLKLGNLILNVPLKVDVAIGPNWLSEK
jgi:hypothetical protein